ncbi:MAG: Rne/Rng family ribonuclease [Acidimicrobiia bacterium]|nr:Rne/Rng family ribonuclease [Acidimicrobiia bacterium]
MSEASESSQAPVDRKTSEPVKESSSGSPKAAATAPSTPKPKIGDTRPAPTPSGSIGSSGGGSGSGAPAGGDGRRRRRRRKPSGGADGSANQDSGDRSQRDEGGNDGNNGGQNNRRSEGQKGQSSSGSSSGSGRSRRRGRNRGRQSKPEPVGHVIPDSDLDLDDETLELRRGRSRKGRPVGRYLMVVSKKADATHIAVLEGRSLIEYYVSRPTDDVFQIHGNIYLGRVQNVLPGMEAAFVDIGTPKNAVIYRGDVQYDKDDFDGSSSSQPKIEQMLKARQSILCQVTKNPIAHKGARLTTEVSLPGRFVVLVPNSSTYGISKRLPDSERKRLRQILDKVRPKEHGLIVRTAAENVTAAEIERDITGLLDQWHQIETLAARSKAPALLYQEPDMSTRVIREEFNKEYRGVVLDDRGLYNEVADYVSAITPALADRVDYYDPEAERLPLFERFHVHEQLHKALDKKVWLPSGGSLIIESTEALTVIDVNTGKNVGTSSLEDTVYANNLEAAETIAQQLRLRDIGGIIVIDFVDMESKKNRDEVMRVFRRALSRDKTRTQVFDISALGLAEMTRKRIGEGLLESLSVECPHCDGRGIEILPSVQER